MSYLLDTNVWIAILNGRAPKIRDEFQRKRIEEDAIFLSSIVLHELLYGAMKSQQQSKNLALIRNLIEQGFEVLDFDKDAARVSGEIRASLERIGSKIGEYDTLIAGHALSRDLILVTANTREFARVEGLKLEDWA